MNDALRLLKDQSVILVDIFAASFLFIFISFLAMFLQYLSSFEQPTTDGSGGLKAYEGRPFTYEEAMAGLRRHAEHWRDDAFVELHHDRVILFARTYQQPVVIPLRDPTRPNQAMSQYFEIVAEDFARFGPVVVPGFPPPNRPHINVFVFHGNHYYALRDEIERRQFSWSEFVVPVREQSAESNSFVPIPDSDQPTESSPPPAEMAPSRPQTSAPEMDQVRPSPSSGDADGDVTDYTGRWDDLLSQLDADARARQGGDQSSGSQSSRGQLLEEMVQGGGTASEIALRWGLIGALLLALALQLHIELRKIIARHLAAALLRRSDTSIA